MDIILNKKKNLKRILLIFSLIITQLNVLQGQFGMGNTLAPLPGNKYPIIYSNDTKGGHHQVATIAERNAIPVLRRQQGMLCTVLDAGSGTPKTYQLIGGILDTNWIEFTTVSTESDPVFLAWDKSSGISIFSTQISDFETSVTNTSAVIANTAKNSYPIADAVKLAGIEPGAEVNVNPDWNATSGDAQIMNKPTTISGYGITDAVGVSTIQSGTLLFASATGSANNYEVNLSPVPSVYTAGMVVNFKANFENTGTATLNLNGLGAKSIKKSVTIDLNAGDIKNGQLATVIYDGTNFQISSGVSIQSSVSSIAVKSTAERNQLYYSATEGSLIYNSDNKRFEYKGVTYWYDLLNNTKLIDLTYPGTTHTKSECTSAGGQVVDVVEGSNTYSLCKFSGTNVSVPAGWTRAGEWQKYDVAVWGTGDICGFHKSYGPIIWSNAPAVEFSPGAVTTAWGCSHPFSVGIWQGAYNAYVLVGNSNTSNHRVEVGAK